MPCYYTGSAEGDAALAAKENAEKLNTRLTKLTQMLCKTCKRLEENQIEIPNGVKQWWKEHKKIDESTRLS